MLYQLPMVSVVWPLYAFHEKLRYIIFTIMCVGQCTRPVYGDQRFIKQLKERSVDDGHIIQLDR